MSKPGSTRPIVVAIDIRDPELAERLRLLLANVAGISLTSTDAPSDVSLIKSASDVGSEVPLTPREHDVLHLLVEGASNKEIARRLGISASTVKFHVGPVLDKLGADGRTDAVANAMRRRIIRL